MNSIVQQRGLFRRTARAKLDREIQPAGPSNQKNIRETKQATNPRNKAFRTRMPTANTRKYTVYPEVVSKDCKAEWKATAILANNATTTATEVSQTVSRIETWLVQLYIHRLTSRVPAELWKIWTKCVIGNQPCLSQALPCYVHLLLCTEVSRGQTPHQSFQCSKGFRVDLRFSMTRREAFNAKKTLRLQTKWN